MTFEKIVKWTFWFTGPSMVVLCSFDLKIRILVKSSGTFDKFFQHNENGFKLEKKLNRTK